MPKKIDHQEIIYDVRRVSKIMNSTPTIDEYKQYGKFGITTIYRKFGSWENFLSSAALSTITVIPYYNNEKILKDLECLSCKFLPLTKKIYNIHGIVTSSTVERRFGSWNKALMLANINPVRRYDISDQELLDDIRLCSTDNKISYTRYREIGKFSIGTVERRFGNWRKALELANCQGIQQVGCYTKKYLLDKLKNFYNKFGIVPTCNTYKSYPRDILPQDLAYYAHFPNMQWRSILSIAGIPVDQYKDFSGLDNTYYHSRDEVNIANLLYRNFVEYEPHKRVCVKRRWTCDFFIPKQSGILEDLWVEYDGLGEYRHMVSRGKSTHQEKIQYYKDHGYRYIVITSSDNIFTKLNLYIPREVLRIQQYSLKDIATFITILGLNNIQWQSTYITYLLVDKIMGFKLNDGTQYFCERVIL
jgi:hypothetical protein